MTPYYSDDSVTIYHGDCREWMPEADVLVTDPPYGLNYQSGWEGRLDRSIVGDADATFRDDVLSRWRPKPALVFGTWKVAFPTGTRQVLIWDKQGALGMGALDLPWKPGHEQIYVLGKGFSGYRGTDVLSYAPGQATARRGRLHPHEKPVPLMRDLIAKCPPGVILDSFMGSGTTLVAAKSLNRRAIGIEIEERYCEIAAKRCSQEVLGLEAAS